MRFLVVSDSHGNRYALRRVISEQPAATVVFHLGDGAREAGDMADASPGITIKQVCGNCDWGFSGLLPESGLEIIGGKRVFYTHGHKYGVKTGLGRLIIAARKANADIVLFGHTHIPLVEYKDGIYFINPGSLNYGKTYAFVDITPSGTVPNIGVIKP